MTAPRFRRVRSLLVGRFQPFHLGHLEAVRRIVDAGESLLLGIGSAQVSHTLANPFTAGERWRMIEAALAAEGVEGVHVVPIPDVNRNAVWVAHVRSLLPPFQVFYSNNALPAQLFREAGVEVRPIPFVKRDEFSGTDIRRRIGAGEPWEVAVHPEVARIVREIHGVERLRALALDDAARRG